MPTPAPPPLDDTARRALTEAPLALLKAAREHVSRDARVLPDLIDAAWVVLGVLGERGPGSRDLRRAVTVGAQAAAGLHTLATAPGRIAMFPLAGRPITVTADVTDLATPQRWLDGLALGCVSRDAQVVTALLGAADAGDGTAASAVAASARPAAPTFTWTAWVGAIQRWWRRDAAWDTGLDASLEGADDTFRALHLPCVPLLRCISARDRAGFDAALHVAVERYGAWWDAEAPADPRGRIALHALGLACVAEGFGIVTRVDAPRLPRSLVTRDRASDAARLLSAVGAAAVGDADDPRVADAVALRDALLAADDLAVQVAPLLRALAAPSGAAVAATLTPREEDWARIFVEGAAEEARAAYVLAWPSPPRVQVSASQTGLDVRAAPARAIALGLPTTRALPGGMARIARRLQPWRTWVSARFHAPGDTLGVRIDGLVWVEDHWVWVPKPWRLLREG